MTTKDEELMAIAICKICTLAEAMKCCPLCKFNIGLVEKEKKTDETPS